MGQLAIAGQCEARGFGPTLVAEVENLLHKNLFTYSTQTLHGLKHTTITYCSDSGAEGPRVQNSGPAQII